MINGEDSESEKRDILLEFIQNMAPDDKAIIFFGKKAKVKIYNLGVSPNLVPRWREVYSFWGI